MGAGGLAGGAERQSYRVVVPGWQERAVRKHLREAIIPIPQMYTWPARAATALPLPGHARHRRFHAALRRQSQPSTMCPARSAPDGFIGVIGRSTGSRRRPRRGASATAKSMSPACRAAGRAMMFQQFNQVGRLDVMTPRRASQLTRGLVRRCPIIAASTPPSLRAQRSNRASVRTSCQRGASPAAWSHTM